ncbi:hypothetical protein ACIRN4_01050 [Pimelobacter simplex]|uniref:hypothetical protein n=1 Tax=Nocardioides simplex TaxID=2045 RepID=UPI0037F65A94
MSTLIRLVAVWCSALSVVLTAVPAADAGIEPGGRLVTAVPAAGTPSILDGQVLSVVQVGRTVVVGGTFTRARDAGGTTTLRRHGLLAFDAVTGRISATFHPDPNRAVLVVRAGPAGTVYVGGDFTSIGGQHRRRLAQLVVGNGRVVRRFNAGRIDDSVRDLRLQGGRLWVAGSFTSIGGRNQRALATLKARTGVARKYFRLAVRGRQRAGLGTTTVVKIEISPNQRRLVAIGNFRSLQHVRNPQLFVVDLGRRKARPAPLRTRFYAPNCSRHYYSYIRDVDFAPDGSYFVVAASGGPSGASGPCDTVARFENRPAANAVPSWVARTGGDTITALEATPSAVYVGGHQRWFNNSFGSNSAGPGAVRRDGLAALSPSNGLPFSWDPGRTKGVGVFDFLVTTAGLWVASDTERIGGQERDRIARFGTGGTSYPSLATPVRPGPLYRGATAPAGGPDWASVGGAFMLGSQLYTGSRDGTFTRRSFDGTTYGPVSEVATADAIVPLASWHDDLAVMTGMFYDRGRLYFTRSGSSLLYYRYFNPESGIVGTERRVASGRVPGFDPASVRGMFATRTTLSWATPDGVLHRIGWQQTAAAAVPVGRAVVVGGPGVDGVDWAGALFVGQGAAAGQGG